MVKRWHWPMVMGVVAVLGWGVWLGVRAWTLRVELRRAEAEVSAGRFVAARERLIALEQSRPGARGGAADYWLGICEAALDRDSEALTAFGRLPKNHVFASAGAFLEARANVNQGRIRAAECRLVPILANGYPDPHLLVPLLVRVYQIQGRFADVRRVYRRWLASAEKPLEILRKLDNLDLGRHAFDGLRAALDRDARLAPEDDRVWLGLARMAIAAGRWDEADRWTARCLQSHEDGPAWHARLDWAIAADRPDEAARALARLGPDEIEPTDRLAAIAWLAGRGGEPRAERAAIEAWLAVEPTATRALIRLAEILQRDGEPEAAVRFRVRKAEVDRAIDRYRAILWSDDPIGDPPACLNLARSAEAAGYRSEARALYARIPGSDEAIARLDQAEARLRAVAAGLKVAAPSRIATPSESSRLVPTFTDDATSAGLVFTYESGSSLIRQLPEQSGGGLAVLDHDRDGRLDLYCVQGGPFPPTDDRPLSGDRLFRNRGDGSFEDVTARSGIAAMPRGYGHGAAVGDIDNDGDPDLFITRWRGYALYRNEGDGTFREITTDAGLGGDRGWPTSAAFADLDNDGDLDLYVCHYVAWDALKPKICRDPASGAYLTCNPRESSAEPDHLFRNDGGRFVDVTREAGIDDPDGRGYGVVAADLDNDGRIDLFVANDMTANDLWRNLGGMRFEEVGATSGVSGNASGGYQAGMGVAAGDLDGDGRIDLFATNFFGESTSFFQGLGDGLFVDHTSAVGLGVASRGLLGFGIALLDADDDGRPDLATANGHVNDLRPNYPYRMPAQLLMNGDDSRLIDVTNRAGEAWRVPRMGRGLVVADLDNDGRQDVLIQSHDQPIAYLHNQTERQGRSLTLRLEGRASNRDAVGARVTISAGGRKQVAWRVGGGSFQSSGEPRLHFGLGATERADSVEVAWPSGRVDRFGPMEPGGYRIREGRDRPEPISGFASGRSR